MLFSLYNNKTDVFTPIVESPDFDSARKMFIALVGSPQPNQITNYIDEYTLYHIGDFVKETGALVPLSTPVSIMTGLEAVKSYKERKKLLDEIYGRETVFTPSPSGDEDTKIKEVELFPVGGDN